VTQADGGPEFRSRHVATVQARGRAVRPAGSSGRTGEQQPRVRDGIRSGVVRSAAEVEGPSASIHVPRTSGGEHELRGEPSASSGARARARHDAGSPTARQASTSRINRVPVIRRGGGHLQTVGDVAGRPRPTSDGEPKPLRPAGPGALQPPWRSAPSPQEPESGPRDPKSARISETTRHRLQGGGGRVHSRPTHRAGMFKREVPHMSVPQLNVPSSGLGSSPPRPPLGRHRWRAPRRFGAIHPGGRRRSVPLAGPNRGPTSSSSTCRTGAPLDTPCPATSVEAGRFVGPAGGCTSLGGQGSADRRSLISDFTPLRVLVLRARTKGTAFALLGTLGETGP